MVKALLHDTATTLQPGGTVDDMIPLMFKNQLVCSFFDVTNFKVTPLVPTWKEITITAISARALAPRDISGKSDPYIVISCGDNGISTFLNLMG